MTILETENTEDIALITFVIKPEAYNVIMDITTEYTKIPLEILERSSQTDAPVLIESTGEVELKPTVDIDKRPEGKYICKTCSIGFDTSNDHRNHFKTDWHRYNLKLLTKNKIPIEEKEFEILSTEEIEAAFRNIL